MAPSLITTNERVVGGVTPALVLQQHTQHFSQTRVNCRLKKWKVSPHRSDYMRFTGKAEITAGTACEIEHAITQWEV